MPFRIVLIIGNKNAIKTDLNIRGKILTQKIGTSRVVLDSGMVVLRCLKNTVET